METKETNPGEVLAFILSALAAGKTVTVASRLRVAKITPALAKRWEASGKALFKLTTDGALAMAEGKGYVRLTSGPFLLVRIGVE